MQIHELDQSGQNITPPGQPDNLFVDFPLDVWGRLWQLDRFARRHLGGLSAGALYAQAYERDAPPRWLSLPRLRAHVRGRYYKPAQSVAEVQEMLCWLEAFGMRHLADCVREHMVDQSWRLASMAA